MAMSSTLSACKCSRHYCFISHFLTISSTPWLTTRRRTCPICKGDVVRSLAHGSSSEPHYEPYRDDASDDEDDDDEETVAEGSGSRSEEPELDLEQGLLSTEPRSSRWSRQDGWLSIFSNNLGRARSPTSEDRSR